MFVDYCALLYNKIYLIIHSVLSLVCMCMRARTHASSAGFSFSACDPHTAGNAMTSASVEEKQCGDV